MSSNCTQEGWYIKYQGLCSVSHFQACACGVMYWELSLKLPLVSTTCCTLTFFMIFTCDSAHLPSKHWHKQIIWSIYVGERLTSSQGFDETTIARCRVTFQRDCKSLNPRFCCKTSVRIVNRGPGILRAKAWREGNHHQLPTCMHNLLHHA